MRRVLRPGGALAILESRSRRTGHSRLFYNWYSRKVLPVLGGRFRARRKRIVFAGIGAQVSGGGGIGGDDGEAVWRAWSGSI